MSEAMRPHAAAPSSWPANSAFGGQHRTNEILDEVRISTRPLQEHQQPAPLVGDIGQPHKPRARRDARALLVERRRRSRAAPIPSSGSPGARAVRPGFSPRSHRAGRSVPDRPSRSASRCCRTSPSGRVGHGAQQAASVTPRPAGQTGAAGCSPNSRRSAASPKNPRAASRYLRRAGRIAIHDTRRVRAAPRPLVANHRPHVARPGPAARFENPNRGLVHPELPRPLQFRRQAVDHGPEVNDALPTQSARVERCRSMPERARICDWRCSGRWSAYFDTRTCASSPSVGRAPSIRRAGAGAWVTPSSQARQAYFGRTVTITRSLRGNDVEPLGAIFADANHLAATARAECALGLDYFLDPRQVGRR